MAEIRNQQELHAEITRLKEKSASLEKELKSDIAQLKEDIKPVNLLLSAISSITGIKINRNEMFKEGFAYGISLLVQRFVLKTERKFEDQIYDWVDKLFEKIKTWLNHFVSHRVKAEERQERRDHE